MAAHVHHLAQKCVARVGGMQRIDLRVLGRVEIIYIVALDGLIEKGQPQGQDEQDNDKQFPPQEIKIAGLWPSPTNYADAFTLAIAAIRAFISRVKCGTTPISLSTNMSCPR